MAIKGTVKGTAASKSAEKVEAVKEAVVKDALVKEEAVKEAVKETVKKVAAKKTPAKTVAKASEKTPAKKTSEEKFCNFYIQYAGKQFSEEDIITRAKEAAANEVGKKAQSIKQIEIYVKPEENAAYYVANGKVAGRIDL